MRSSCDYRTCNCMWCVRRRYVELARAVPPLTCDELELAEPDEVTKQYDINRSTAVLVER